MQARAPTPAHRVVARSRDVEARGVVLHRRDPGSAVATCPVCGSQALSVAGKQQLRRGAVAWVVRCGACETWRGYRVDQWSTRWGRLRLRRRLRRDRRRMRRQLWHAQSWGFEVELDLLTADRRGPVRSGAGGPP
jgi:hypothetical protein